MREWKLVFSQSNKKMGPASRGQNYLGIRKPPTRVTHAVYIGEAKTVCGQSYDGEDFPDKTAGLSPNCGSCHNELVFIAKKEKYISDLIDEGADVNAKDKNKMTALHWAAYSGNPDLAKLIIAKGADINAKDRDGSTPLHKAAYEGNKDVAELLIAMGVDLNAKNSYNETPMSLAIRSGHKGMADLLEKHGAQK